MDRDLPQSALAEGLRTPWVQALALQVEIFDADSVTLRLPFNPHIRGAENGKSVSRPSTTYALL